MHEQQEQLSPDMIELLQEETVESEILGAMDAAAEEGIYITRDEAIQILIKKTKKSSEDLPKVS